MNIVAIWKGWGSTTKLITWKTEEIQDQMSRFSVVRMKFKPGSSRL